MTQDFREILKEYKALIEPVIFNYLNVEIPGLVVDTGREKEFQCHWDLVSDYPKRGGKYWRPTLLVLSAESLGGKRSDALLPAAAMEVCEDWLLSHDDFEDNSMKRRGDLALHRLYSPQLAVNAGDVLSVVVWKIIGDTLRILGPEKMQQIHDEFYHMLMRTAYGQTFEVSVNGHLTEALTDSDYYFAVDGKTSYYTVGGPLRLGALVACDDTTFLNDKVFPVFNELGVNLGRAFQIIDDVLDLTSNFDGKKERGGDIYEGKLTLMVTDVLMKLSRTKRERVLKILNAPREENSETDVHYVINLMQEKGSIDYARREAEKYAAKSREIFSKITFMTNEEARAKIQAGIDFVVERTQ